MMVLFQISKYNTSVYETRIAENMTADNCKHKAAKVLLQQHAALLSVYQHIRMTDDSAAIVTYYTKLSS